MRQYRGIGKKFNDAVHLFPSLRTAGASVCKTMVNMKAKQAEETPFFSFPFCSLYRRFTHPSLTVYSRAVYRRID